MKLRSNAINTSLNTDSVFHSRAVRSLGTKLEDDPDVMVHQQLARLRFFEEKAGTADRRVLDFGCGSGFNCYEIRGAKEVLGFDVSADAIAVAKASFPNCRFLVADGCDRSLSLGRWERIICCEVLEHVPDMESFLDNLRDHLAEDGIAFISTPNRDIFSLGHESSPINREHIKELDRDEFLALLGPRFSKIELYGQRFKKSQLLEDWKADAREKIVQLQAGRRWREREESRLKKFPLVRRLYALGPLRAFWKWLRWSLIAGLESRVEAASRPYDFRDFEFVHETSDAIWFCAIVQR